MNWDLILDGGPEIPVRSSDELPELLKPVRGQSAEFAILVKEEQFYIQTRREGMEFLLEKREGSEPRHYVAMKKDQPEPVRKANPSWKFWKRHDRVDSFPFETIVDQFMAFMGDVPARTKVCWIKAKFL